MVYEVRGGSIIGERGALLRDLQLTLASGRICVVVGPSGVGKTSLLRALGDDLQPGLSLGGEWLLDQRARGSWDASQICLSPQERCGDEAGRLSELRRQSRPILLLDEPAAGASSPFMREYVEMLQALRAQRLTVVVTHNLELVRSVADDVVLLCDGQVDCISDVSTFFESPPTDMARQFVRQGNCWPRAKLPRHFHWIDAQLAGMGRPGLLGELEQDLAALGAEGVDVLVSLTERRIPQERLSAHGITGRHLAIADMGVPALNAAAAQCREVQRAIEAGSRVAFHCDAGLGRTGTMLAALLVWRGTTADEAVAQVRSKIRGAIQTDGQVAFVRRFAEAFGKKP